MLFIVQHKKVMKNIKINEKIPINSVFMISPIKNNNFIFINKTEIINFIYFDDFLINKINKIKLKSEVSCLDWSFNDLLVFNVFIDF